MTLDDLIEHLQTLQRQGHGKAKVTMMDEVSDEDYRQRDGDQEFTAYDVGFMGDRVCIFHDGRTIQGLAEEQYEARYGLGLA